VTRKRWPNGVEQPDFFRSSWHPRRRTGCIALDHAQVGTHYLPVIDTREGLAWISQQAALEVHVPQCGRRR